MKISLWKRIKAWIRTKTFRGETHILIPNLAAIQEKPFFCLVGHSDVIYVDHKKVKIKEIKDDLRC